MPLAEAPEQHIDGPQSLSHHQEYTVQALLPKVTKSAEKFWTVEKYDWAGETEQWGTFTGMMQELRSLENEPREESM